MSLLPSHIHRISNLDAHAFICTRHSFIYVRTKYANLYNTEETHRKKTRGKNLTNVKTQY